MYGNEAQPSNYNESAGLVQDLPSGARVIVAAIEDRRSRSSSHIQVWQTEGQINVPDRQEKTACWELRDLRYANHSNRVDLIAVSLSGHNGRYHHLGLNPALHTKYLRG